MSKGNYICKLPDELLLQIVQCIPTSKPDLKSNPRLPIGVKRLPLSDYRSVLLVCRRLNHITTSVMYMHYNHEFNCNSSTLFIKTIFQRPDIARIVQSIKEIGDETGVEPYKRSHASIECLCDAVRQLNLPCKDHALQLLKEGKDVIYGLETALIIALTPRIQTLALNCPPYLLRANGRLWRKNAQPSLQLILSAAQGLAHSNMHQFEHLRKLRLNMAGLYLDSISSVLRLKSLVHLTLFDYVKPLLDTNEPEKPENSFWQCPLGESQVKMLRLLDFDADLPSLVNLVSSCHSLEAFTLRIPSRRGIPPILALFISELHRLQPNLRVLSVVHPRDNFLGHITGAHDDPIRLGSLKNFSNLKYLDAPLELLVSPIILDPEFHLANLLPQNLESFVLSAKSALLDQDTSTVAKTFHRTLCNMHVESLVDACRSRTLDLTSFGIQYATDFSYKDGPRGYAESNKDLARMDDLHFDFYKFTRDFKNCGVHFDYVIVVDHNRDYLAHERLISVRRIHGNDVAEEYSDHLWSTESEDGYDLAGFKHPNFLTYLHEKDAWVTYREGSRSN